MDGSGRGVEFSAARTGRRRIRETGMVRRRRADGTGQGGEARGRRAKRKARSRSIDARRVGRTSHSPRTFHKCSVLSAPAVATVAPSGENSTHVTASSWPSSSMMGASREDVRWCAPGLNFCLNEGCATANAAELPRRSSASARRGRARHPRSRAPRLALRLPAIARSGVVMTRRGFSDFVERTRRSSVEPLFHLPRRERWPRSLVYVSLALHSRRHTGDAKGPPSAQKARVQRNVRRGV